MDRRSKGSPGTKEDLVATTGPAGFRELVAAISAKCKLGKVGELERTNAQANDCPLDRLDWTAASHGDEHAGSSYLAYTWRECNLLR